MRECPSGEERGFVKDREIYAGIRAVPPVIIRLDGRAFHSFLADLSLKRPYDERFAAAMVSVCTAFFYHSGLSPLLAYTFSDEISMYLRELPFEGRVEKMVSVVASFASSSLTIAMDLDLPVAFDARIIPVEPSHLPSYLAWRQKEAWRNHINGYSQALLLQEGLRPVDVQRRLNGLGAGELHEICFQHGVNLAGTPAWERRGIMVYKQKREREGRNPVTGETTRVIRNMVVEDRDLPLFSRPDGEAFISGLIC